MKIASVNVGLPQKVTFQGKEISTGIFKSPTNEPVMVRKLNLDGDRQADLRVHGGVAKAVYAYPQQHYAGWKQDFPQHDFPTAVFGENLTVDGLDETTVNIGDQFLAGECELQATQPRFPCFKLGIRFGDPKMIRHFLQRNQPGVYFSVIKEGSVQAGDSLTLLKKSDSQLTITDIVRLYAIDKNDKEGIEVAANDPYLPEDWRTYFAKKLQ
ncbi:MAG: MOSC domain-containing protein [Tunicatimonas sp.]|uniref:MOSC domain-containing protein n=1 Tax=Tunicatimonas sp. TaxID=1940096 RepID=UPI003C706E28